MHCVNEYELRDVFPKIVILVNSEHQENAESPIVVTPVRIVILVNPEQLENAYSPIVVTFVGIVILVNLEQSKNA